MSAQRKPCQQYPRGGTGMAKVLRDLKTGIPLTALSALHRHGVLRLAAVVFDLRRMGWAITACRVAARCRDGRIARVARYSLS